MLEKHELGFNIGLGEMFRFILHNNIDVKEHSLASIKELYENRTKPTGRNPEVV